MKEKEIVQRPEDTDPEMLELWPLVEKCLDEAALLKLREPQIARVVDDIIKNLTETKEHSRRMVAFHKDIGYMVDPDDLESMADPHKKYKKGQWVREGRYSIRSYEKGYDQEKYFQDAVPLPKDPTQLGRDWKYVTVERPKPESVEKLVASMRELKEKTRQLMKIRRKTDPKLKDPLYKVLFDRLAALGRPFSLSEAGKIGYQIQLERGQRPTSQSARLRKSLDTQNLGRDFHKIAYGLKYVENGMMTLEKDYTLHTNVNKLTKEQLGSFKKDYIEVVRKIQKLQEKLGVDCSWKYHSENLDGYPKYPKYDYNDPKDCKRAERQWRQELKKWYEGHPDVKKLEDLERIRQTRSSNLKDSSIKSALKEAGIEQKDGFYRNVEKKRK